MSKGFAITQGKGFHMTFANGNTISVQFGPANYCDNYDRKIDEETIQCGKEGSSTAEVWAWNEKNDSLFDVLGYQTPEQVLELMRQVSA